MCALGDVKLDEDKNRLRAHCVCHENRMWSTKCIGFFTHTHLHPANVWTWDTLDDSFESRIRAWNGINGYFVLTTTYTFFCIHLPCRPLISLEISFSAIEFVNFSKCQISFRDILIYFLHYTICSIRNICKTDEFFVDWIQFIIAVRVDHYDQLHRQLDEYFLIDRFCTFNSNENEPTNYINIIEPNRSELSRI